MVESRARTPTPPDDEITSRLEPADPEPHLQPQNPRGAASSLGVETQQGSDSSRLSPLNDRCEDSDGTSDPEDHHPPAPDNKGEQDEEGRDPPVSDDREKKDDEGQAVVPSEAQETAAGSPGLSHDGSNNDCELAGAEPLAQPFMQSCASQHRAHFQHPLRRRQHRDTDDGEDYRPTVGSDAKHKRRRVGRRRTPATEAENPPANATSTSTSQRTRYTSEDDMTIRRLRWQLLSWPDIAKHFPGRTARAIAVRYYTKLKAADPEWEVEEIRSHEKLADGSVKLLVKWKGGEETWEPYENLAEAEALDKYEGLHGRVTAGMI